MGLVGDIAYWIVCWALDNQSLAGGLSGGILAIIATTFLILFLHNQHQSSLASARQAKKTRKAFLARRIKFVCRSINFYAHQYTNDLIRDAEIQPSLSSKNPLSKDDYLVLEEASEYFDSEKEKDTLANLYERLAEHQNRLRSLKTLSRNNEHPIGDIYEGWHALKSEINASTQHLTIASERLHRIANELAPTSSDESGLLSDV